MGYSVLLHKPTRYSFDSSNAIIYFQSILDFVQGAVSIPLIVSHSRVCDGTGRSQGKWADFTLTRAQVSGQDRLNSFPVEGPLDYTIMAAQTLPLPARCPPRVCSWTTES